MASVSHNSELSADLNRKMPIWEVQLKDRPKYPAGDAIATGEEVFNGNYDPRTVSLGSTSFSAVHLPHLTAQMVLQIMGGNAYDPEETFHFLQREANARAYDKFFGRVGLGAMPYKVMFVCCSQFAVTRERVRLRSKDFWAQNMHYMLHNDLQASNLSPKHHVVGKALRPLFFRVPIAQSGSAAVVTVVPCRGRLDHLLAHDLWRGSRVPAANC